MTLAPPQTRDRDLADLVRDLDSLIELLQDTPPDEISGRVHISARERDALMAVLMHAADTLHELRG